MQHIYYFAQPIASAKLRPVEIKAQIAYEAKDFEKRLIKDVQQLLATTRDRAYAIQIYQGQQYCYLVKESNGIFGVHYKLPAKEFEFIEPSLKRIKRIFDAQGLPVGFTAIPLENAPTTNDPLFLA